MENYFDLLMSNLGIEINNKNINHVSIAANHIKMWNEERVTNELKKIIKTIGHFPMQKELNKSLKNAMVKYGGSNYFADKLGFECKKFRYWNDNTIKQQLELFVSKENNFPKREGLISHGLNKLACAVSEHGG
jgi:hypothetical protein